MEAALNLTPNQSDFQTDGLSEAHLRQLGPVKRFVALEELSSQVAVLSVQVLQNKM